MFFADECTKVDIDKPKQKTTYQSKLMKQTDLSGSGAGAIQMRRLAEGLASVPPRSLLRRAFAGMTALALGAVLAVATTSSADAAVYTRFDSAGALDDWNDVHYPGTPSQPVKIVNGPKDVAVLEIARPTGGAAANNAFVYYTGSEGGIVDGKVADFEMTSVFSTSWGNQFDSTTFGFMVRAQEATYGSSGGYYIAFSPKDGGTLTLFDSPTTHTANGTVLDSVAVSLSKENYYLFKLSAVGSTISASVWSEDGNTLLAEVEYGNARLDGGYFGVRTGFGNTVVGQYVKDISVTVIPEPATIGFTLMGGAAMLMILRRRRG